MVVNRMPTFNRSIWTETNHTEERTEDPRLRNEYRHRRGYQRTKDDGVLFYEVTYKGKKLMQTKIRGANKDEPVMTTRVWT